MLSDFHFLRPLWLLALIPLAGLLWRLLRADGEGEAWRGVVDRHLLPSLLSEAGDAARRSPLLLLGLAWLLIVLALAGPTWERLPEPLYQARQFRVIALDLSPTMNATDLAPSRLARARYEVLDLLHHSEGQTALLAYGAEPYVVSPLTGDVQTIAAQVPLLETGLLPVAGDRRADLVLERAGELLRQAEAPDGQVILVTDTLDHPAAAIEAARRLRSAGYRVSVLGMGTDKGGPVAGPDGGFVKDSQGAIRIAKLDLAALRELADAGGGRYVTSGPDDRDIEALTPRRLGAPDAQSEASPAQADRWREEGPWLLLVLLPLAALAFRRGWLAPLLLLICLVPPPDAYALGWGDLWLSPDQRATRMLQNGQPEQAAQLFERPDWRAAAHYQANDYAQTLQSLEALEGPSADYNRGNALARMDRLEEALKAYDRALGADPGDADARHNRDLVQRVLDQRRQQQQAAQRAQQQKDNPDQQDQQQSGESQQAQQQQGEEQKDQQQSGDSQQAQQSEQAQQDQSGGQGEQTEQTSQQANAEDSAQGQPSQQQAGQDAAGGQQQAQDGKGQDSTTRASAGQ
ncbi:MAG: VWA domain-containing protein, partial [Chromatiaceae bacterium]|nr:VWA domain-containing protein [Chromatiaceae bacterium]